MRSLWMYSVSVFHAPLTTRQLSVCSAHTYLFQSLLFLSAIVFYTLIIIKVAFGNVNVKFDLPIAFPYIPILVQVFNLCICEIQHYNNIISVPATIRHNPGSLTVMVNTVYKIIIKIIAKILWNCLSNYFHGIIIALIRNKIYWLLRTAK